MSHNWKSYRKKPQKSGNNLTITSFFKKPGSVTNDHVKEVTDQSAVSSDQQPSSCSDIDEAVVSLDQPSVSYVQSEVSDVDEAIISLDQQPSVSSVQSDVSCSDVNEFCQSGDETLYAVPLQVFENVSSEFTVSSCHDKDTEPSVTSLFTDSSASLSEGSESKKRKLVMAESSDARRFARGKYEAKFQWLYYSQWKKGYMCKFCELFSPSDDDCTPYITCGAVFDSHPTRRLEIHEKSRKHQESVEKYTVTQSRPDRLVNMLQAQTQNVDRNNVPRNRRYIKKLFKTCAFLVQKNWAQSNFADLVKFIGRVSDPEIAEIQNEDVSYLSSTSVTEIIMVLSDYIQQKLLTDLKECGKFTLLADESTDTSNRTQLSIFARWVRKSGACEHYMGLVHVERTTSLALMEAIGTFCQSKGIELMNVRFVGLDGCNTMRGEQKGLQRRIRHESPYSLYINCRNHRLALCFVHMMKASPLLVDVDATLIAIWKVFHFSPKKAAAFKNVQEAYGEKPLTFVRAATTRWLSHLHACVRFITRFDCLLDTMDSLIAETHEPELTGIRNNMLKRQFVATTLILADMLRPVNYLSLYLQEDCGTFTELPQRVKQCTDDY